VSIDDDRGKFERAVKNAAFPWGQVFDGQATNGALVKLFNARGVPISYLVAPDGKVAAKMVNGAQLQQQITNVMEKQ
jgi:hypothetical protein